jgi:hypothetical protein
VCLKKKNPTDGFVSETFSRRIFCWQLKKVVAVELLSNYHQSPE